jgi:hypothetical protein
VRRNITVILAVVLTIGGLSVVLADDLHGAATAPSSDQSVAAADPAESKPTSENYQGFFVDFSEVTEGPEFSTIFTALRHQIDIVDSVNLSKRVLEAFHSVPILVDEFGCVGNESLPDSQTEKPVLADACYGARVPGDLAQDQDISRGVVILRPSTLANYKTEQRPILLRELLHFYHAHIFPLGVQEPAIFYHYKAAEGLYQNSDGSILKNEQEFFAVTASIFLYGKDGVHELTRAQLKEKQPDYYKYLVWLFGIDPSGSPLASAN